MREQSRTFGLSSHRLGFSLVELLVVIAVLMLLFSLLAPSLGRAREHAYRARCRAHLNQIMAAELLYTSGANGYLPGERAIVDWRWHLEQGGTSGKWGWKATIPTSTGLLHRLGILTDPQAWLCPKAQNDSPDDWYHNGVTDPYTYHFTTSAATMHPSYSGGAPCPDRHRRIETFPRASESIVIAEENTGMIDPAICFEAINDPWFTWPDVTEPRHMDRSQAAYLDGHVDEVEPYLEVWRHDPYCPAP